MLTLRQHIKPVALLVIWAFGIFGVMVTPLKAELITTNQILDQTRVQADRIKVKAFLDREDVQKHLENMGVDAGLAKARVDNLTDEEVTQLAQKIDQMPAGSGGAGTVVLIVAIVFVILLITDLMGLTDIFPFVKKR